jgi:hypothetical protein
MNKKISGFLAAMMIAAVAAWNVSFSSETNGMSDVALANVEALADIECTAFSNCGTDCPGEYCGYCFGFYMLQCFE